MDLVIIHSGAAHGIYGSDLAASLIAVEPPLWVRLIAGYIRDHGYSVEIIDAEAMGYAPAQAAEAAVQKHPRLIAIAVYGHQPSASTQQMDGAGSTAQMIKLRDSTIPTIMVGGHVAALPEQTLREESIDYACNGEGPTTILGLLRREGPPQIPGLVWREPIFRTGFPDERKIYNNPPAELIATDKLHGDAWDLLPTMGGAGLHSYRAHNWQVFGDLASRQPYASIYTSLGCPYKCSFCCINSPFGINVYRTRSPEAVVTEIKHLYDFYGVRTFKIIDELFILNPRHYIPICDGIIAAGLGDRINIWAYARVDTVAEGTLGLLRKAGIRWLALGIESASAYVRDGASKRLKNDDIMGVVRAIQAADINVIGNFIFGLPDDDARTMGETLDLAVALNCEFANFYSAMAYPGSPLYAEALQKGWALPESWRGYSQHNSDCRPLDTLHVSAAEVLRFRDYAFDTYFNNERYLTMVERKFGADTLAHVKAMTTFKLKRKLLPETMLVEALVDKALAGDVQALDVVFDRVEEKKI